MKNKKFFCLFSMIILLLPFMLFSEDNSDDSITSKKKKEYFMKFRGNVRFGVVFYPGHHRNIADTDHLSFTTSDSLDYTDEGDPDYQHHSPGDPGRTWGTGAFATHGLEGKIYADFSCIAPFFAGDHFLLKDNNIALNFKFQLSPVSLLAGAEVSITPVPFLVFSAGTLIGSAWNIPIGTGLARNNYTGVISWEPKKMLIETDSFLGPVMLNWFSATFQFDTAAIMPEKFKRWTHIVMQATPKVEHKYLMTVDSTIPYTFENDAGENFNGWKLYGTYILGYKIPVIIDPRKQESEQKSLRGAVRHNNFEITLAMMAEMDGMNLTHYSKSTMSSGGYGSDFVPVQFGPMMMFDLPNNLFALLVFNWKNEKEYTSETVGNANFFNRKYEDWYVYFHRIALVFGWNF